MPEPEHWMRAPELAGGEWLNSEPLTRTVLRGKPYLIDFWDYTCANCIRTLPYLREWHRRYEPLGLRVIGVHAPEFSFGRSRDMVRKAIESFDLQYPIALDAEYQIWQAYSNRSWPAKYLVDVQGFIRYYHFGERGYTETEGMIQKLLREADPQAQMPPLMEPVRDEDWPNAVCYMVTPELYAGYARGKLGNPQGAVPDRPTRYRDPGRHAEGYTYLDGTWVMGQECAAFFNAGQGPGKATIKYTSKEVNLVLNTLQQSPGALTILQDGQPLPREDWGADVSQGEGGASLVTVDGARMYRLANNRELGSHELSLVTESNGLALYAFTFISCVAPRGG